MTASLVAAHDAMIEAGAGAWDPEETAPALAHLVAATTRATSISKKVRTVWAKKEAPRRRMEPPRR